mmetsp:Transcript_21154/g.82115  ORF Transcript_21154/g.82115 Transcript_21154/m.82115 type:complete len:352 (-) Transcript_21154:122-1177(-)
MARFGEGDPRWRVEEREDGRNVNAWHWSEKNCTQWSKEELKKLFTDLDIGNGCTITSLEKVTGDVMYCNRKRKNMFFYDLELKLKWKGKAGEETVSGDMTVANFDQDADDLVITPSTTSKVAGATELRRAVGKSAVGPLQKLSEDFKKGLWDEFSEEFGEVKLMQTLEPVRVEEVPELCPKEAAAAAAAKEEARIKRAAEAAVAQKEAAKPTESKTVSTRSINQKVVFEAPLKDLFNCFVESRRLQAFTQSDVKFETTPGFEFAFFGGQVQGVVKKIVTGERIVLKWRSADWPAEHYSLVTMRFAKVDGGTELTLKQIKVPSTDVDRATSGWSTHFWQRIRAVFGYPFRMA